MEPKLYGEGHLTSLATLGLKKSLISLGLNKKGIKKSGKGGKGNSFFNRQDYIGPLLELLVENKCYTLFSLGIDNLAIFEFGDDTGAKIIAVMPWERVNIVTKYDGKKILDPMQEIGAGGSYAKRYLEVWFFDLAEEDVVDMAIKQPIQTQKQPQKQPEQTISGPFIVNKLGHKLSNPKIECNEADKIKKMYGYSSSKIEAFQYDKNNLIKNCINKMVKAGFVETDSKEKFPLEYLGALLKIIVDTKTRWEQEYIKRKVKEKIDGDGTQNIQD